MVIPDKSLILKKFPLFSDLSDEEYLELDVSDNYKEVKKDEYIYFEAYQHQNIYFLKTGLIRLGYLNNDGVKIIKDMLHPGDFFGQISLSRENLNGEFAQAVKADVSLCSFTLDNFNALLANRPKLSVRYSKISGFRIRRFENRLENILRHDVKTRLQLFLTQLLSEARDFAKWVGKEVRVPNYLTHEEIAQLIGTSRQTVTTLLNAFKEENFCSLSRKELCFYDMEIPRLTKETKAF
jgi:CRP/FNR family transcriptional regulator, cyclic AMP receptor protein